MLPEQRLPAETIEAHAVGDLDEVELFFFGQDGVDVGVEERVGFEDASADGALGGGFYFGFGAGGEALRWLVVRLDGFGMGTY